MDSTIQLIPTSKGRYDDVPVEVSQPIPDSTEHSYLATGDQMIYDPLSIPPDSDSPRLPAFAQSWVPESDEDANQQKAPAPHHHHINGIADVWEPASDHEVEGALQANIVADSWECASDKEPASVQALPATIIADSWECTSDEEQSALVESLWEQILGNVPATRNWHQFRPRQHILLEILGNVTSTMNNRDLKPCQPIS